MSAARLSRAMLVVGLAFGLQGFQTVRIAPVAPDHPDDPRWSMFRGVQVDTDLAKGVAAAHFPPDLMKVSGQTFEIAGYMTPLDASGVTRHFILTRRSTGCPFCPPNEANEAIEVFTERPVQYADRQILVTGKLTLLSNSNEGLFFRMQGAKVQ
jgi:hypothetical protein